MESGEYWEMLFADWNEMYLNYLNKKTIFSDYFHLAALKETRVYLHGQFISARHHQ